MSAFSSRPERDAEVSTNCSHGKKDLVAEELPYEVLLTFFWG